MNLVAPGESKLKCYLIVVELLYYGSMVWGSLAGVSSEQPQPEPVPVVSGSRTVTAVRGQAARLGCRVKQPGARTVSWLRQRDLHVLTSGEHTYTADGRIAVDHPPHSDAWDLRIEPVQRRDAGVYQCQVNTEPRVTMAVVLRVEDAQASIWGSADVYVKRGSTISLTCSVNVRSVPASSVQWLRGPAPVDFDSQRGGINLETERTDLGVVSKLLITNAALADSGNYTCVPSPSNASSASVQVHVLNGEQPAAMQTSKAHFIRKSSISIYTILCFNFISIHS